MEINRDDICMNQVSHAQNQLNPVGSSRFAPAVCSMFATNLALIGARDLSFLSCLAYGKLGLRSTVVSMWWLSGASEERKGERALHDCCYPPCTTEIKTVSD